MGADRYTYRVAWSADDSEYVGLCDELPSLSWLAESPEAAQDGIRKIVSDAVTDLAAAGSEVPVPFADLVTCDPDVLAGEAVFSGTRVPVRTIAAWVNQGISTAEILKAYPGLDEHMICCCVFRRNVTADSEIGVTADSEGVTGDSEIGVTDLAGLSERSVTMSESPVTMSEMESSGCVAMTFDESSTLRRFLRRTGWRRSRLPCTESRSCCGSSTNVRCRSSGSAAPWDCPRAS